MCLIKNRSKGVIIIDMLYPILVFFVKNFELRTAG